ncbi:uncharacterized protein LOC132605696 [Lycium barbarum]|uniref:uncharacterized protein LOC132605696 n=1 Tax=Lycium barbarum TaxID=112863 RepID=UPI00293E4FF4|nr:uncharacterized protein LOC132605696 [Lycium barbarum]
MASTVAFHSTLFVSFQSPKRYRRNQKTIFALKPSQFLSSSSLLKLKKQTALSTTQFKNLRSHKFKATPLIFAAQSNFLKVLQTAWRVGKDGVEAGTNMVPDAIPRPIARIAVTVVGAALALFVLKSFLSTALFVLTMMGVIYFGFIALNKDDGPKGGGGTGSVDDSLEEARRIMEKYK